MTQRERQFVNQNRPVIRAGENPYLERVMRLIGIGISIAVSFFAISAMIGTYSGANRDVSIQHNGGLELIESAIQNRLDRYYADLNSLGADQNLINHLTRTPNIVQASTRAGEILQLHLDEYERIQFIEIRDGEAFLAFDRQNVNNIVTDVNSYSAGTVYTPPAQSAEVFNRLLEGDFVAIAPGEFYLAGEDDNRVFMDAYVPIYTDNQAQPDMIVIAISELIQLFYET